MASRGWRYSPSSAFSLAVAASQEHTQRRCKKTPSVFRPHLSGGDTKQGRHLENHTRHDPVGCTLGMSVGSPGLAKAGSSTLKSWLVLAGKGPKSRPGSLRGYALKSEREPLPLQKAAEHVYYRSEG